MAAPTSTAPERVSLLEAAELLGVHYMTAYRYVRTGQLPATKRGAQWRVDRVDLERFAARADPTASPDEGGVDPASGADHPARLQARLVAGDESGAWEVVQRALAGGLDPESLSLTVLAPALRAIGDGWEAGVLSVADEHRAAAVMIRLVGRLGPQFTRRGRTRGTVVLGARAGDHHSLPTLLFGDLLRGRGLAVVQLGADTPSGTFVEAARQAERLVAVAITGTVTGNQRAVRAAVTALHQDGIGPVVVGGRALSTVQAASRVGADDHAPDAVAGLDLLDRLAADRQRRQRQARRADVRDHRP